MKKVKLGDVCEVIAGQSPPSETYNKSGNGLPFFQGKADFGNIHPEVRVWCTQPQKIALPNDILLSVRAPVGPTNLCKEKSCIGRGLCAIRLSEQFHYKFVLYFFKKIETKLANKGVGSTFSAITQNEVKNLEIPLPDLATQQKTARILDQADALRQKDKHLLALYDQLLQSVFLDLFGIEEIEKYDKKHLWEVSEIVSGVTKNSKNTGADFMEVPYMRVANVQDGYLNLTEVKSISVSRNDIQKYLLKKGDLLLTEGGDPDKLGRGCVWYEEIPNCIHQNHIFRVRGNGEIVNSTYLSYLIGSEYGKAYFLKAAKQTTGIASINMGQLKQFPLSLPPLALQEKFAAIVAQVEAQKALAKQQLAQSETLFQSLLQRAFG